MQMLDFIGFCIVPELQNFMEQLELYLAPCLLHFGLCPSSPYALKNYHQARNATHKPRKNQPPPPRGVLTVRDKKLSSIRQLAGNKKPPIARGSVLLGKSILR